MKRSKRYTTEEKKVDKDTKYIVDKALELVKDTSTTKFDSSIDIQITLNLKEKQKKESLKGTVSFTNMIGEAPTVIVIAEAPDQKKAKAAGADVVGLDDIIEKIEKGWDNFDVLITTPNVMGKVAKLGKSIGAKGLMPNPKNGTVTKDIEKAVNSFKAGKTNFKMNEQGIIQLRFAKVSMKAEQIKQNFDDTLSSIKEVTKRFGENIIKSIVISSSMGPSIKIDMSTLV